MSQVPAASRTARSTGTERNCFRRCRSSSRSDPWASNVDRILARPVDQRREGWVRLGRRHFDQVDSCDLLVAILDQEPPDNGTVCELAYAAAKGIPVIGYRNDKRTSGEEGVPLNLMILAAIRRSHGTYTTSLGGLLAAVRRRL
jgi:Nucleoside 2-deoxyribosyltransferase